MKLFLKKIYKWGLGIGGRRDGPDRQHGKRGGCTARGVRLLVDGLLSRSAGGKQRAAGTGVGLRHQQ